MLDLLFWHRAYSWRNLISGAFTLSLLSLGRSPGVALPAVNTPSSSWSRTCAHQQTSIRPSVSFLVVFVVEVVVVVGVAAVVLRVGGHVLVRVSSRACACFLRLNKRLFHVQ